MGVLVAGGSGHFFEALGLGKIREMPWSCCYLS
jgi:hypothetical protein